MQRRHASLVRAAADFVSARGALASIRATPANARALDDMDREIAVLNGRLEASAPRVDIAPEPGALGAITIDGTPVTGATDFRATRRTRIVISGVGEIAIAPPAAFGEAEKARLSQLEAARAKLLADCGAADAAALRADVVRRAEIEARLDALRAGLAALDCKEADLPAATSAIAEKIEAIKAQIADVLGDDSVPDAAIIEAKQEALQQKRKEATDARRRSARRSPGLPKGCATSPRRRPSRARTCRRSTPNCKRTSLSCPPPRGPSASATRAPRSRPRRAPTSAQSSLSSRCASARRRPTASPSWKRA